MNDIVPTPGSKEGRNSKGSPKPGGFMNRRTEKSLPPPSYKSESPLAGNRSPHMPAISGLNSYGGGNSGMGGS